MDMEIDVTQFSQYHRPSKPGLRPRTVDNTNKNDQRNSIFLKSTNKQPFELNNVIKSISQCWSGQNFTRIAVHQSKFTCLIETDVPSINFVTANIHALEAKLGFPIKVELFNPEYRTQKKDRYSTHAIATQIPISLDLEDIKTSVENVIGIQPILVVRITSGLTGRLTNYVRIIMHDDEQAKRLIDNGLIICGVLKVKCERPNNTTEQKRCYRCQLFGHDSQICDNDIRCRYCSLNHPYSQCSNKHKKPVCLNCRGEHMTSDKNCPAWRKYLVEMKTAEHEQKYQKEQRSAAIKQTEDIKLSYAETTKQSERNIIKELDQNNRNIESVYDEKLKKLRQELLNEIDVKIKSTIDPILRRLDDISKQVQSSESYTRDAEKSTSEKLVNIQKDLTDIIHGRVRPLKSVLRQATLPQSHSTSQKKAHPSVEQSRADHTESPQLLHESYTDFLIDDNTQSELTADSSLHATFSEASSIDDNTLPSPQLQPVKILADISPIKQQSEQNNSDRDKVEDFIIAYCKHGENSICDECEFLKVVVDKMGKILISGRNYNFPDSDRHRLKKFKGIENCFLCTKRNILADIFQSYKIVLAAPI